MTLRDQLIRDEGVRLTPYRCSAGKLTIGVGRNLDDVGISRDEAMTLLDHDIRVSVGLVVEVVPSALALSEARRAVLVGMVFNLGLGGFLGFQRMLAAVEAGDFDRAADEMLASRWAQQVGPRAVRLAEQMRKDTWH